MAYWSASGVLAVQGWSDRSAKSDAVSAVGVICWATSGGSPAARSCLSFASAEMVPVSSSLTVTPGWDFS